MSHPTASWQAGRESGPAVVALGAAVALSVIALDLVLAGEVGLFFDLWFVVLCLGLALLVRPGDFFTVGVLPPLIMLGAFTVVALSRPEAIADPGDNLVQAVVSGLAHHSAALVAGYTLCLVTLWARQRVTSR